VLNMLELVLELREQLGLIPFRDGQQELAN
jgi:hypothetical protein